MARNGTLQVEAQIIECLPNTLFRAELPNGHRIIAHLPKKTTEYSNQILPGDKVLLEMTTYDLTKGRITFRQK